MSVVLSKMSHFSRKNSASSYQSFPSRYETCPLRLRPFSGVSKGNVRFACAVNRRACKTAKKHLGGCVYFCCIFEIPRRTIAWVTPDGNTSKAQGFQVHPEALVCALTKEKTQIQYYTSDFRSYHLKTRDKWVPVSTAWPVLGLRMEERLADMKSSCEYME